MAKLEARRWRLFQPDILNDCGLEHPGTILGICEKEKPVKLLRFQVSQLWTLESFKRQRNCHQS